MILYEVIPSQETKNIISVVEASHKWALPGVRCNLCGATWGSSGVAYPLIDLSGLSCEKRIRELDSWPIPLDELEELKRQIANLLPHNLPLPSGTQFGPLVGSAEGPFEDIVWNGYLDILVKADVLEQMRSAGAQLSVGVRPRLIFRGKHKTDLFELQIEPRARMVPPPDSPSTCSACGRWGIKRPEEVIIKETSVPDDVDLFRIIDFATIILATERFSEIVRNHGITGIDFRQVKALHSS